ncbi:hypothetical protein [Serratia liquefaciens]|nr:hypothetical protein [Serratia liquefaciens]
MSYPSGVAKYAEGNGKHIMCHIASEQAAQYRFRHIPGSPAIG